MSDQFSITAAATAVTSKTAAERVHFHYGGRQSITNTELAPGHVLVSFQISPINPQDLMVIAGLYPVKPVFKDENGEGILGYDGVARVEAMPVVEGDAASASAPGRDGDLHPGDLVIPRRHGLGTWRRTAIVKAEDLIRLPPDTDPLGASLLRMVFLPAYLMVEDTRPLKPGDWIVQNAASGAIARLVTQFARLKGCHVCSVVRDRDSAGLEALRPVLQRDGASVVITEGELRESGVDAHPRLAEAAAQGRVALALDGVFGEPGERLASLLSKGATYADYGSLGGADGVVRLSQRLLFWNEVSFGHFRLSENLARRTPTQQESLLWWFAELLAGGKLSAPDVTRIKVPKAAALTGQESSDAFEKQVILALSGEWKEKVGAGKHVLDFGAI
ncbi:hypothetical protein GGTG_03815 [Gaeumannomyces tritici R3-111a-1]|uniref:enoyl-[acyl-carrier-protein] reductase n=1 Tax=Gaeumannomyces tritici (strain R3-111a-1) TaxID=644352 RepID=J3NRB1_GAET3|nr:hypothetical protein GGTG_03815 [Gaeumannomyces tritici R3-111a-1]EJT78717.1 hypothetical protein GGTG_03815 [Gaeumannomyces tritici R3-111a-1]